MRSHAKASSAGSTEGRGASRGSFVRGADATRGSLGDSDGSGAPSRRRARIALSLFAALLALAILAATALASKDLTTYIGGISGSGSKGGEFNNPRDVAVNESGAGPANPGDTYVADEANNRIERFSSSGTFISAWGANATHRDEVQKLVLNASSGSFTLSFEGDSTEPLQYGEFGVSNNALDDALDVLPGIGGDANVNVTSSGFGGNQTYTITFTGALTGTNVGQLTADASELEGTVEVSTTENGSGGGGSDYEICTTAGKCGQALASGGNGTAAGNGTLSAPQSVAVDEDTGNVYVSDRGNRRIDEYDGEGNFIRAFGWNVVEPTTFGSGDLSAALGIAAYGTSGEAYVSSDNEVHVFGAAPTRAQSATFDGSDTDAGAFEALRRIAVDQSNGTVYAIDNRAGGAVIDKFDSSGAAQDFSALGSSSLSGADVSAPDGPLTFDLGSNSDIAVDNSPTASNGRIYVLQQFGGVANFTAFAFAADGTYLHKIALEGGDTACGIAVDNSGDVWISDLTAAKAVEYDASGAATGQTIDTSAQGAPCHIAFDGAGNLYAGEHEGAGALYEYDSAGAFDGAVDTAPVFSVAYDPSSGRILASHSESASEYGSLSYQVCEGSEACRAGTSGSGAGQYGAGSPEDGFGIAVSPADGNASTGSVFLADSGNRRVDTFDLDGASPDSFGSSSDFGEEQPRAIAVDSRGIVYASDSNKGGDLQRYDTEDANGGGVGFLAPILPPNDEVQKITFSGFATGDKYELTCPDGTPTAELAYVTGTNGLAVIRQGLEEACGSGNVSASGNPPNTTVTFTGALGGQDQPSMTCTKLSGAGSCSVSTTAEGNEGPLLRGEASSATAGLAVDPAEDVLYVLRDPSLGNTVVQQFGPDNEPGLLAAPTAADDIHGGNAGFSTVRGLGLNGADGKLYVSATNEVGGLGSAHRVYVLGEESSLSNPSASMDAVTAKAARSATFTGSVNPNGGVVDCRFQYSTDESHWTDVGSAKGTGELHKNQLVTSVSPTEGAFAVGQTITSSDGGIPPGTKITAVDTAAGTISLGNSATTEGPVTLTAVGSSACPTLTPSGGSQSIGQEVPGLVPDTEYFARLQVTRPGFPDLAPLTSNVQSFTTDPAAPLILDAAAKPLDDSSVRVSTKIDPAHSPTVYVVQYGTTPALGSSSAPIEIGEGSAPVEASTVIHGLSPSTAYYFKVVATNLTGSVSSAALKTITFPAPSAFGACPNDLLRTGPSAHLPDCRAYEQASPADKAGSDVNGDPYSVQASPSGDGITFHALAGFPGAEGFRSVTAFLSRFSGGQWSTRGLTPPSNSGDSGGVLAWTPDLRLSFARAFSIQPALEGQFGDTLLMRDSSDGSWTTILPQQAGEAVMTNLAGAFDNNSKVVFEATGNLPVTSGPAWTGSSANANLYLYDRETGELTLAGLLPDSACGSPPCVPGEGSKVATAIFEPGAGGPYIQEGHAVSTHGDVYFIDVASKQLYLRREAASPGASTVPVSASERTDCADNDPCAGAPEPDPAGTFQPNFAGATPDGAHAFFTSEEELTDEATTATGTEDLYRFDPGAPGGERLTDLAPGAEVRGVLGYSDDGSYVYFAANADLDGAGPASGGSCSGSDSGSFEGKCSLYLWHEGEISLVARLDTTVVGEDRGKNSDAANWLAGSAEQKTSRVSADGKTLLFRSQRKLTDYDNHGSACREFSAERLPGECAEFYRYEAESGQVDCLTCDPSGAAPISRPELKNPNMYHAPSSGPVFSVQPFLGRNLSADGKRFFFESPDKLVAADVNGDVSCPIGRLGTSAETGKGWPCLDVYEWEAPDDGSCTTTSGAYVPSNGGCIYLLSTGTGPYPSYLADVSESGDTAFIFSRQQLVPSDEDSQEDIYAVKVNGGLAYQHAVRPAGCEGDACRGASSQPSSAPGAGTAAFQGPGDPEANTNKTRCPKGKRQVRRKGKLRCVAKHAKHRKHKRHQKRAANHNRRASR